MKKYLLPVLFCLLIIPGIALAQISHRPLKSYKKHRDAGCPKFYLGFGLGVNNPNGLIGLNVNIPVLKNISISTGAGISSWGWKYFGEIKGFVGECHNGWAAGLGMSHNTGISDYFTNLETTNGSAKVKVEMTLFAQTNAFINVYHFWGFGRDKMNRFYVMAGYSAPLTPGPYYEMKSQQELSDNSKKAMKTVRPGGLSIGIGFYFCTTR